MLKGRLATYPGHVRLVVHPPIQTTGMARDDSRTFAEQVRRVIIPDAQGDVTSDGAHSCS